MTDLSSTEQAKWMETMMNMSWEATKQVYGWVVENYDGAYKEKVTFILLISVFLNVAGKFLKVDRPLSPLS